MNIARYNLGGSAWKEIQPEGFRMQPSRYMPKFKEIEGFWLDWKSTSPNSSSWNWSADENQRAMVGKAVERGVSKLELFSNAPMWWMTKNWNPAGYGIGISNCLNPTKYQ